MKLIKENLKLVLLSVFTIMLIVIPSLMLQISSMNMLKERSYYEVLLLENAKIKEVKAAVNVLNPEYKCILGDIKSIKIENKKIYMRKSYGDIEYFSLNNSGNINLIDIENKREIVINKDSVFKLFNSDDGIGNTIFYENNNLEITGHLDFSKMSIGKKHFDGVTTFSSELKDEVNIVYISNNSKENIKIDKQMIQASFVNLSEVTINDFTKKYTEFNSNNETIKFVISLLMIAFAAGWLTKKQYKAGIMVIVIGSWLIITVNFKMLPLEYINEQLVSLTYYINLIKSISGKVYDFISSPMSYGFYKLNEIIFVQKICYMIAVVLVFIGLKKLVKQ